MRALILLVLFHGLDVRAQVGDSAAGAIEHVTVIDVATGQELRERTVRMEGTKILSVTPTEPGDAALPGVVDGRGRYVIPGLWDMHIHVHETSELPLYIANGVTGVRVMAGARDTAALRKELGGVTPSPEIYLASAIVDGPSPMWPGSIVVKHADDARRTVDEIKAGGADFIKVYDGISRDAYFALAEEAKAQHIDFAGHVPESVTAQEASNAGQRSMEHLQGIALGCSSQQQRLTASMQRAQFFRDRLTVEAEAYRSFDAAQCQTLFAELRRNETWQVPTLTVRRMWGRIDDSSVTSDPRLVYVGHRSRDRWAARIEPQMRRWGGGGYRMARGIFSADERIVGGLYRAGVTLMAGTDAMNPYCIPGFSLHDELALLVESGLTPLAALQAATLRPAAFLHRSEETGTVAPGKTANLVLLREDPLTDIRNTTKIEAVWLAGRYFDRAALDAMLETAKRAAKH